MARSLKNQQPRSTKGSAMQTDPSIHLLEEAGDQPFRFVFLPDIHLRPDKGSPEGMAACLQTINDLDPAPAFLLTGGDQCDELRDQDLEEARERVERFIEIWNHHVDLPTYHCVGNHDLVGWDEESIPDDHPHLGMGLMQDYLEMEKLYYSFDCAGWHIVVLDNIHRPERGDYIGKVDEEQLEWLREDLRANAERPAIVASHLPPITAVEFFSDRPEQEDEEWRLSFQRMAKDPRELLEVLREGNVRAFLSGHLHLLERLELLDHTFICCGSVSGHKWEGPRLGTPEGFTVLDCQPDGNFTCTYQDYGWQARNGEDGN
jgi:3',5'-cyclic-AMP phosphodiesterase